MANLNWKRYIESPENLGPHELSKDFLVLSFYVYRDSSNNLVADPSSGDVRIDKFSYPDNCWKKKNLKNGRLVTHFCDIPDIDWIESTKGIPRGADEYLSDPLLVLSFRYTRNTQTGDIEFIESSRGISVDRFMFHDGVWSRRHVLSAGNPEDTGKVTHWAHLGEIPSWDDSFLNLGESL